MNCKLALIFSFFLSFFLKTNAQELPPIISFSPQDYHAENQNWAISQSQTDKIYVANNSGLLEFDGAHWQLYPSPNETILRSVLCVNDLIYTGAHMEFGFWKYNKFGNLEYSSLSNKIKNEIVEDEQFWKISQLDNWILFQSLNRIYLYNVNNDSFKIIDSDSRIFKMFKIDGDIYFQKINAGILKLVEGEEQVHIDHPIVKNQEIVNIFYRDNKFLIQTQNNGIYQFVNNQMVSWDEPINDNIKNLSVYSSLQLKDGTLLLGTISNGVVIISKTNKILYSINKENGLENNTVLSLFNDVKGNLWLGLDNGIGVLNLNSPIKVYHDDEGVLGSVYASAKFNNKLYLGTNQGLFYKDLNEAGQYKFIEGTEGQVWCLVVIRDTLFCGHNSGTFVVNQNRVEKISNVQGTWNVKSIPDSPNYLLQGNYDGLNVLEKKNGEWKFRNTINGFTNSSKSFEFIDKRTLYVNHEYKGIYKIKLDNNFENVETISIDSINKGLYSDILKYNNSILYSFKDGIFRLNKELNQFDKDSVLSKINGDNKYLSGKLINDADNRRLWSFNSNSIWYLEPGKLQDQPIINNIPLTKDIRNTITGYENILHLKNEEYIIGTTNGYILIDLQKVKEERYNIQIVNVLNSNERKEEEVVKLVNFEEEGNFDYEDNSLKFSFSIPDYKKFNHIEYQYKLEGLYNEWSNWTYNTQELFENLPSGDYVFKVRGRVNNTLTTNEAIYKFNIARPWQFSNLMIAIYALAILLFSLAMHNIYKQYYAKQKRKLIEQNKKEIELKELESKQQLMRFKNEQLESDIENKNRELAISTMSLIKKNEFLSSIKNQLLKESKTPSMESVKSVVKVIDKNLNNTDDWKMFEEAFNNADKDFLKKIKSIHSGLTPNDLKLCAYLRLNLSSKEIAPLLNISTRSVEVKRYRLRKKMNLSHENSLTNYILEI